MKALLVILILVVVYVFYPQYDLMVKHSPFDEHSTLEGKGYLSESSCREAARAINAQYFHCSARTLWGGIFGSYTSYDPQDRYDSPEQFKDLHRQ